MSQLIYKKYVSLKTEGLEAHRKNKITIMKRDFMIELEPDELEEINHLTNERDIDYLCRKIILQRLSDKQFLEKILNK